MCCDNSNDYIMKTVLNCYEKRSYSSLVHLICCKSSVNVSLSSHFFFLVWEQQQNIRYLWYKFSSMFIYFFDSYKYFLQIIRPDVWYHEISWGLGAMNHVARIAYQFGIDKISNITATRFWYTDVRVLNVISFSMQLEPNEAETKFHPE